MKVLGQLNHKTVDTQVPGQENNPDSWVNLDLSIFPFVMNSKAVI
jgi:hypothetical protein